MTTDSWTDEALRIAIAEQLGWEVLIHEGRATSPIGVMMGRKPFIDWTILPDYPHSLDACAEMRKALTKDQKEWFLVILYALVAGISLETKMRDFVISAWMAFHCVDAEPRLQCLAFVKTLGLSPKPL